MKYSQAFRRKKAARMKRPLVFTAGLVACLRLPASLGVLIQQAKELPGALIGFIALGATLGGAADLPGDVRPLGFDQVLFVKRLTYNANHY